MNHFASRAACQPPLSAPAARSLTTRSVTQQSVTTAACSIVLVLSLVGGTSAEDWPQWLGPHRDGVWREDGIVERFPKGGPPLRWKTPIGSGYSGPAVADGRVFVMDRNLKTDLNAGTLLHADQPPSNQNFLRRKLDGTERVVCLRESDGEILWTHEYDCAYTTVALYAIGPRCTPTVDNNRVYTLGAQGNLFCLDSRTGKVIWSSDFQKDFGLELPEWGVAAHPLIDGEQLICVAGGRNSTCVAFDKRTGQVNWKSMNARQPGYCPPVIYEIADQRHLIIWDSENVSGLDPANGNVRWSVAFPPTFAMSIGAPQQAGNQIYVMSFSRKSALIRVADDGQDAEIVWKGTTNRGVDGVLNTAIVRDGHIYGCGYNGRYICARLSDGERLWETFEPSTGQRPASWANVFTVPQGDRYFHANDQGDLIIAQMTPDGYTEIDRAHLIDPTHDVAGRTLVWSHPAFANRSIYLRNDGEIRCYSLSSSEE